MVQSPDGNKTLSINTTTIISVVRAHVNRGWLINDIFLFFSWRFWRSHLYENRVHLILILLKLLSSIKLQ